MIRTLHTASAADAQLRERLAGRRPLSAGKIVVLCVAASLSAMLVKDLTARTGSPALVAVAQAEEHAGELVSTKPPIDPLVEREAVTVPDEPTVDLGTGQGEWLTGLAPSEIRYFDGRPVRPVKTLSMTVTAYSPDARSCGTSADGITASLHDVTTNAHRLVAADSRVLPLGSIISVPGYDQGNLVPVLDRGGAIKGPRLDVLMPTHEEARRWGVRTVTVTVWDYADGGQNDWRKVRDSKR